MGYLAKWKSLIQPPVFLRNLMSWHFSLQLPLGGDVSLDQLGLRGASKHFLLTSQEMPEDVVMLGSTCLGWVGFMEGKGLVWSWPNATCTPPPRSKDYIPDKALLRETKWLLVP